LLLLVRPGRIVLLVSLIVIAFFLFSTGPVFATPNPAIANIKVGGSPDGVVVDTNNGNVYFTDSSTNNVTIISSSTNTVVGSFQIQTRSGGGAYDPVNREIYIANDGSNTVSVINDTSNTIVTTVTVGLNPVRAAYDSANQNIYVSNFGQASVSVIDSHNNTVVGTVPVGSGPAGLVFDPYNNEIFVTNFGSTTVSVIDGSANSVISTIFVGAQPDGATFNSATGDIYISNYNSNSVTIINGSNNSVIATLPVGTSPEYAAYAGNDHEVYVTNRYSNTVTAIFGDTTHTITTVAVGANPRGIAFDPINGELYVSNNGDGTISVIRVNLPTLQINPSTGPVGTKVLAQGTNIPVSEVEITFDDVFIGITTVSNSSFSFTLDVPQAQLGNHQIKAVDQSGTAVASTNFVVSPSGPPSLGVTVTVGTIYFPGDTVVARVLVSSNGMPLSSSGLHLQVNLTRPDNSNIILNVTSIGSGIFKVSYSLLKTAQIGTYSILATATDPAIANGSALSTFEVKLPWLSSQTSTIAVAGVAVVATLGVALVSWRKGYLKRSSNDAF
jgi:YVTN family beta-propeller protein